MTVEDSRWMARALQVAHKGQFWAAPNPHVGCVLVRDGEIIGEGFTQPAGGNHAEVEALKDAGNASGATAYVTLEPCAHHGRTGPCSEALIEAGVTRVVVGLEDPNPAVSGKGLSRLTDAGVEVTCGLMADQAREMLAGFLWRMERGRGRVTVKLASSLDGRTAMASGESHWITGAPARADVQQLRAASSVILTGSGSVITDDCRLTLRADELTLSGAEVERATRCPPQRAVLDSRLITPASAQVYDDSAATLLFHGADVACTKHYPDSVERIAVPLDGEGLDLHAVFAELNERQHNEILVESGPRLAGALLQEGLVDRILVYMAPVLMGSAANPLMMLPLNDMSQRVHLDTVDVRRVGQDWRFTLVPQVEH